MLWMTAVTGAQVQAEAGTSSPVLDRSASPLGRPPSPGSFSHQGSMLSRFGSSPSRSRLGVRPPQVLIIDPGEPPEDEPELSPLSASSSPLRKPPSRSGSSRGSWFSGGPTSPTSPGTSLAAPGPVGLQKSPSRTASGPDAAAFPASLTTAASGGWFSSAKSPTGARVNLPGFFRSPSSRAAAAAAAAAAAGPERKLGQRFSQKWDVSDVTPPTSPSATGPSAPAEPPPGDEPEASLRESPSSQVQLLSGWISGIPQRSGAEESRVKPPSADGGPAEAWVEPARVSGMPYAQNAPKGGLAQAGATSFKRVSTLLAPTFSR